MSWKAVLNLFAALFRLIELGAASEEALEWDTILDHRLCPSVHRNVKFFMSRIIIIYFWVWDCCEISCVEFYFVLRFETIGQISRAGIAFLPLLGFVAGKDVLRSRYCQMQGARHCDKNCRLTLYVRLCTPAIAETGKSA